MCNVVCFYFMLLTALRTHVTVVSLTLQFIAIIGTLCHVWDFKSRLYSCGDFEPKCLWVVTLTHVSYAACSELPLLLYVIYHVL